MDNPPLFTIILPTYNERENLEPFVAALMKVFDRHSLDGALLIVDDNSPDGTGKIADELAAAHPDISVLHRPAKEGLGPAYIAGFQEALKTRTRYIFEMDCDFSHEPERIPEFLKAIEDSDLVIGSRYVPGGSVKDWGLLRRLISRGGGLYARTVLGIPVNDLTGGFKCFRREVLEAIDLGSVSAQGYGFQIELTYRTIRKGFRVKEIPITFANRVHGESKMSNRIILEAAVVVWKLKLRPPRA